MAKTRLVGELQKLLRLARALNQNPGWSVEQVRARRQFILQSTKYGFLALPAVSLLTQCSSVARHIAADERVAILGGGMAGLTAAFYLTQKNIPCEIFESSARVGGRMMSTSSFNHEGMLGELGGEFIDTSHSDIIELCQFFKIPLDQFASVDAGLTPNIYYFKNGKSQDYKYYLDKDAVKQMQVFDRRFKADARRARGEAGSAFFDRMTLEQYLAKYRGEVDPWFLELIRIAYVGEMGLEADVQTAILMITNLDPETSNGFKIYGKSDQAFRIRGGNQALVGAMEKWLLNNDVKIHKSHALKSISDKTAHLDLQFDVDANSEGRGMTNVKARKVICTVPFSVLKSIDGVLALRMSQLKKNCIKEMVYGTNAKIILGYHEKLWRTGISQSKDFVPPSNGMVYTDLFPQNIWETSRAQPTAQNPGKSGVLTNYLGGKDGANLDLHSHTETCLNAIDKIFPGTKATHDKNRAHLNWTKYKHNLGSYASATPTQITRFGSVASAPELDGKLLFAGEHVAESSSGFMNGAVLSGKAAAKHITG